MDENPMQYSWGERESEEQREEKERRVKTGKNGGRHLISNSISHPRDQGRAQWAQHSHVNLVQFD